MYYPNTDEEDAEMRLEFGKFRLNYVSERLFQDFAIRIIECENAEVCIKLKIRRILRLNLLFLSKKRLEKCIIFILQSGLTLASQTTRILF